MRNKYSIFVHLTVPNKYAISVNLKPANKYTPYVHLKVSNRCGNPISVRFKMLNRGGNPNSVSVTLLNHSFVHIKMRSRCAISITLTCPKWILYFYYIFWKYVGNFRELPKYTVQIVRFKGANNNNNCNGGGGCDGGSGSTCSGGGGGSNTVISIKV